MKFSLRKRSGSEGTEIKISVTFSPEETSTGLTSIRDDENVHLDRLRISGTDFEQADHTLMLLRSLAHYADLWSMRHDPAIGKHILHNRTRHELVKEAQKRRKKRKRT